MFNAETGYPTAIASYDDEGVAAAIRWCVARMQPGDTMTVWTSLKSNLKNCPVLKDFVDGHRDVEHVTGRGWSSVAGTGPVLMAWADMDDVGKLVRFGSAQVRGLCVIAWNVDGIRPWVTATAAEILGDGTEWEGITPDLDPIVEEALDSLTLTINHNNTIAAGWEKDQVVGVLMALYKAGVPMDADAMQGRALALGWSGKNPEKLAQYVRDINTGKRPRHGGVVRSDYVDQLRRRIQAGPGH